MNHETDAAPVIAGLVDDLMFQVEIGAAVQRLGYRLEWIRPDEDLLARIVALQPAVLLVDIADPAVHGLERIAQAKSDSATRRVPALAFGLHMDVETLQQARRAGAEETLARSRFMQALPGLLEKYARVLRTAEWQALDAPCAEPLPEPVRRGLEEFNAGKYYECHETLEHAWGVEPGLVRDLYRAILQIAVAYHHARNGNLRGALKMFARSKQWFHRLPDRCRGVDVARLRADAARVEAAALAAAAEGRRDIDLALLKPVEYDAGTR